MSQSVNVEIATSDKRITWDLMEPDDGQMSTGESNQIAEGAKLVYRGTRIQKGLDIPSVVQMTLDMGGDVAVGVVSAWLYDKLKNEDATLTLGGEQVAIKKERIQAKLEELRQR